MPLQLRIVSEHHEILGEDCERLYLKDGGTIGRSLENDWILPDPDRYLSGRHATVDYQSGAYYLADISSNGVYVNDEPEPLGNGNPRRLFDGDRLRMGDIEFIVSLDEGEDLQMPSPPTVVPDHIDLLLPEEPLRTGIQLLSEEEITGDDEFQSALFGKNVESEPDKKNERINNAANPFKTSQTEEATGAQELLDAFLGGLGIDRLGLNQSTDKVAFMENAGRVLKEFVSGTRELLVARAGVKNLFRLDQTTVLPRQNNPLKLAENTEDSIRKLLVGKEGENLAPLDSVREVCRDLRFHHDALLEGMTQAFLDFANRFDPDELKENFDRTLNRKPLFASMNQRKYWQLYCDLYPIITQQGPGQLPYQFGEEFVRAYEKQIAEYKRFNASNDLLSTDNEKPNELVSQTEELVDQVEHSAEW